MPAKRLSQLIIDQEKKPKMGYAELWDSIVSGLHVRISHKGKRTFFVRYRIHGKQRRYKLGNAPRMDLAAARAAANDALCQVEKGTDPAGTKAVLSTKPAATLHEVAQVYFRRHVERRLKTQTQSEIKDIFEKRIFPVLGEWAIRDVKRREVKSLINDIAEQETDILSNKALARLKAFYNWAIEEDYAESNPAIGIKLAKEKSRDRVLSESEIALYLKAARAMGYPYGDWALLLLYTGQRRTEVSGLEWAEVDENAHTWTIPEHRSKTKIVHDVHFSAEAWSILEAVAARPNETERRFVFVHHTELKPISGYSWAKKHLDEHITQLNGGTPIESWTFHDIRRSATTTMARYLKVDERIADRVIGHKQRGSTGTAGIYNRYEYWDERREALEKLGSYLSTLEAKAAAKNVVTFPRRA